MRTCMTRAEWFHRILKSARWSAFCRLAASSARLAASSASFCALRSFRSFNQSLGALWPPSPPPPRVTAGGGGGGVALAASLPAREEAGRQVQVLQLVPRTPALPPRSCSCNRAGLLLAWDHGPLLAVPLPVRHAAWCWAVRLIHPPPPHTYSYLVLDGVPHPPGGLVGSLRPTARCGGRRPPPSQLHSRRSAVPHPAQAA